VPSVRLLTVIDRGGLELRFRPNLARALAVVTAASAAAVVLAACGSSSSSSSASTATAPKPNTLALTISDTGKTSVYAGPTTTAGGLLQVQLTNKGKAPHGAQLVLILGKHSPAQALRQIGNPSGKTPGWLRAVGGVGYANPGETATATDNVPAGKYLVFDVAALSSGGPGSGPPAHSALTVTPGTAGPLPATTASVTAATAGKDKYKWNISGLKAGANRITFNSKGSNALHILTVVRLKGHPTNAQIEKGLSSNSSAPPSFVDTNAPTPQTAALDGGKSQTTTLNLPPGRYVFFCPLHDRDGGKPHFLEGLLKQVVIH
jgi:hypothetical protein